MSSDRALPDYPLDDLRVVTATSELRAMFHPLRGTLLDLTLERAATVSELAAAIGRPPSTVAYHVNLLVDAGLFQVVRTRKVRAITERFYGRTARLFQVGQIEQEQLPMIPNILGQAAKDSEAAHRHDDLRAIQRHARIPVERAEAFWAEVLVLARSFSALPRSGSTTHAFVAGVYPVARPSLAPPPEDAGVPRPRRRRRPNG